MQRPPESALAARVTAAVDGSATADRARTDRVRAFWAAYEARDWVAARQMLSPTAQCTWWTSRERFAGPDAIVQVNAVYPEGWSIQVLAVEPLPGRRVLSLVRVDHGDEVHYAHSWFALGCTSEEGAWQIEALEEFWAADTPPPAWREGLAGRVRTATGCLQAPLTGGPSGAGPTVVVAVTDLSAPAPTSSTSSSSWPLPAPAPAPAPAVGTPPSAAC